MATFLLLMQALQVASAAIDTAAKGRELYKKLREQAERTNRLTPEQIIELDAAAEIIFASDASKPSDVV